MAASLKSTDSLDIVPPDMEPEPSVPTPPSEPSPPKQPPPTSQGVEKPPDGNPGDNAPD
jgi:hypothetical protein